MDIFPRVPPAVALQKIILLDAVAAVVLTTTDPGLPDIAAVVLSEEFVAGAITILFAVPPRTRFPFTVEIFPKAAIICPGAANAAGILKVVDPPEGVAVIWLVVPRMNEEGILRVTAPVAAEAVI